MVTVTRKQETMNLEWVPSPECSLGYLFQLWRWRLSQHTDILVSTGDHPGTVVNSNMDPQLKPNSQCLARCYRQFLNRQMAGTVLTLHSHGHMVPWFGRGLPAFMGEPKLRAAVPGLQESPPSAMRGCWGPKAGRTGQEGCSPKGLCISLIHASICNRSFVLFCFWSFPSWKRSNLSLRIKCLYSLTRQSFSYINLICQFFPHPQSVLMDLLCIYNVLGTVVPRDLMHNS